MRSPVETSMSYSRGCGCSETSCARRMSSSVVLPMAESTATTFEPVLPGRDEPLGDPLQLVGVADRGAAELHHDEPGRPAARLDRGNRFEMDSRHLRQCRQAMRSRPATLSEWVDDRVSRAIGLCLLPWTLWLSASLQPHHVTNRWDLAWSGFDSGLALLLLATAFAAYRARPGSRRLAATLGTLLITDAWFDIVLESHADELRTVDRSSPSSSSSRSRRSASGRPPDRAVLRAGARARATSRGGPTAPARG